MVAIHQTEFLSYLGFWDKISNANKLVFLDEVDFRKNYFQNRNQILMNGNPIWFGVEIEKSTKTAIKDVKVSSIYNPTKKIKTIEQAYSKSPHFKDYAQGIISILEKREKYLVDYNYAFFFLVCDYLGIDIKNIRLQSMNEYEGTKSDLILNICNKEREKYYLSGKSGIDYLNIASFEKHKILVKFQDYQHPVYNQFNSDKFVPYMSIIDLLFNEGPNSLQILKNEKIGNNLS